MEKLVGINVLEFSGESCANCYSLMPVLNKVLEKYNDVKLIHIEVSEQNLEYVKKYEVNRVPTIIVLKDNNEVDRCCGFQPEEILDIWLESKIQDARNNILRKVEKNVF